ncbi:MAG: acyl transferase [Chitinophagia bacterium]|nr:acyl transferase [Chitinophagia bacterium]
MVDVNNIFSVTDSQFDALSLETFAFQYQGNVVYREWCDRMGIHPESVRSFTAIPALPVSFFKSSRQRTTEFVPDVIFESSGTTGTQSSYHEIKDRTIYEQSYSKAFRMFYGEPTDWCILALLPSYLERGNSSLVYMVNDLLLQSKHPLQGFYLHNITALADRLKQVEAAAQKTLLIGVTYALLDFAEEFPMQLLNTVVMETGGMKGRREELTREQVHEKLQQQFQLQQIHSEYGMTELLSQAYSSGNGRFHAPPWMRVLVRDERDPLLVKTEGEGLLQVVDLANQYSCAFIALDDVGRVYADGSFEVWGRRDHADLRGCSLLSA